MALLYSSDSSTFPYLIQCKLIIYVHSYLMQLRYDCFILLITLPSNPEQFIPALLCKHAVGNRFTVTIYYYTLVRVFVLSYIYLFSCFWLRPRRERRPRGRKNNCSDDWWRMRIVKHGENYIPSHAVHSIPGYVMLCTWKKYEFEAEMRPSARRYRHTLVSTYVYVSASRSRYCRYIMAFALPTRIELS